MAAAAADAVKKATRRTYEGLMGQLEGWCHENQGRFPGIINADTNEIDIDVLLHDANAYTTAKNRTRVSSRSSRKTTTTKSCFR